MEELPDSQKGGDKSLSDDGSFSEVRRKRRRARPSGMDITENEETPQSKRPSFGPVDASTTLVSTATVY